MKNKILVMVFFGLLVCLAFYLDATNRQRLESVERATMQNNLRIFQLQKIIFRLNNSPSPVSPFSNYQNRKHEKAI